MKFFDCHIHLPTPDVSGLVRLRRYLDGVSDMVGGNLILNAREEVDFAYSHLDSFPKTLNLILYYAAKDLPSEFRESGWHKIHPTINKLGRDAIAPLCHPLREAPDQPKRLIVHCFPCRPELQFNISLPL